DRTRQEGVRRRLRLSASARMPRARNAGIVTLRSMKTQSLFVDAQAPAANMIAQAAAVLRAGGLVAFPTETVYGLGANALDAAAVARIFTAKGRPATNPLIVHVLDT